MITYKLNNVPKTSLPFSGKGRFMGLLFFLLIKISLAQPVNTINQEYDLNDPRNPNCPCHKYQKMADDEFKKLQKKDKSNHSEKIADKENRQNKISQKKNKSNLSEKIAENQKTADNQLEKMPEENTPNQPEGIVEDENKQNINAQKTQVKVKESSVVSGNSDYSKKHKRKKLTGRMHKFTNFFTLKPNKTRKVKPIYSICFKW